jgi:hypothetical protein
MFTAGCFLFVPVEYLAAVLPWLPIGTAKLKPGTTTGKCIM